MTSQNPSDPCPCPLPLQKMPRTQAQAPALQRGYQIPGYNDYAQVRLESEQETLANLVLATPVQLAQRCKSSDLVFPQKLHMLLTASEQDAGLQR
jgi:hypothetical protein